MLKSKPKLIIFAGPNGSGKSSVTEEYPLKNIKYINADDIAANEKISNLDAAIKATQQREDALKNKKSFAFETVMSMPDKIDLMAKAKEAGFNVKLIFVTTQDSEINLDRVKHRVTKGGHDVPKDKITARYERSMKLLPQAISVADEAKVFNNSFKNPVLILEKLKNKEIKLYPQPSHSKWDLKRLENLKAKINNAEISSDKKPTFEGTVKAIEKKLSDLEALKIQKPSAIEKMRQRKNIEALNKSILKNSKHLKIFKKPIPENIKNQIKNIQKGIGR